MILHDATVQYLIYLQALGLSKKRLGSYYRVLPDVQSFYGPEMSLDQFDDSMVLEYIKQNDPFETDPVKVARGEVFCEFVHWLMRNHLIPAWEAEMQTIEKEQKSPALSPYNYRFRNDRRLPYL